MVQRRPAGGIGERLALLDERLGALQESLARDLGAALEGQARLEAAQVAMAQSMAEQDRAHAVLAQWMRDWVAEVTSWRSGMDRRMDDAEARQEQIAQDADQARGALRAAMWVFGTAVTLATGVLSGVAVRLMGEWLAR